MTDSDWRKHLMEESWKRLEAAELQWWEEREKAERKLQGMRWKPDNNQQTHNQQFRKATTQCRRLVE